MPLPRPRTDEPRANFIKRFMQDSEAKKKFPDTKQRAAVAFSTWRDYIANKRKRAKKSLGDEAEQFREEFPLTAWLIETLPLVTAGLMSEDTQRSFNPFLKQPIYTVPTLDDHNLPGFGSTE